MEKQKLQDLKINKVAKAILLDYMSGGFKLDGFDSCITTEQDFIYLVKNNKEKTELKIIKDYSLNEIRVYKNKILNNVIKL